MLNATDLYNKYKTKSEIIHYLTFFELPVAIDFSKECLENNLYVMAVYGLIFPGRILYAKHDLRTIYRSLPCFGDKEITKLCKKEVMPYLLEIEDTPGLKIHVFAYDKLTYSDFRDPLFMSTTFIEMLIKK